MKNTNKVLTYLHIFLILAGCGINGQITSGASTPDVSDCGIQGSGGSGATITGTAAYWPYSQCRTDAFSVTNPGGISPPTICGKNQGRHSKLSKMHFNIPSYYFTQVGKGSSEGNKDQRILKILVCTNIDMKFPSFVYKLKFPTF